MCSPCVPTPAQLVEIDAVATVPER
jgi:hypothetical protein